MPVSFQQYRGERGAPYNHSCKYTLVQYSYKFNSVLMCPLLRMFSCLAFFVVIFIKGIKKCTESISKASIISLHLLTSYSLLKQLPICPCRIKLSGDIKPNPRIWSDILVSVLLISCSLLKQLWICSRCISLSGDIKLNLRIRSDILISVSQCFSEI